MLFFDLRLWLLELDLTVLSFWWAACTLLRIASCLPRNALVPEQSPGPEEVWPAGKLMTRVKSPALSTATHQLQPNHHNLPTTTHPLQTTHRSVPTEVGSLLPGLEKWGFKMVIQCQQIVSLPCFVKIHAAHFSNQSSDPYPLYPYYVLSPLYPHKKLPVFYNSSTPYSLSFMPVNTKERLLKYWDCIKTKTGLIMLGHIPW